MAKIVLIVDGEPSVHALIGSALAEDSHQLLHAYNGAGGLAILAHTEVDLLLADLALPDMSGLEMLTQAQEARARLRAVVMTSNQSPQAVIAALRHRVCDLLYKPFALNELRLTVGTALTSQPVGAPIEVLSTRPEWLTLRIPCDLGVVQPLYRFFTRLEPRLPLEVREAIGVAFRELLQNAIEHGGHSDPAQQVLVSYVRGKQVILCSIKDPGVGFNLEDLGHAAVSNPSDDPYHHLAVRDQRGLRPGGFGILLAHQLVDELIYNDCRNEVIFAKYI